MQAKKVTVLENNYILSIKTAIAGVFIAFIAIKIIVNYAEFHGLSK